MPPLVFLPDHRPHKFHARPITVDGIRFASTGEATRFHELQILEKSGRIGFLARQVKFELHVKGACGSVPIGSYVADFDYWENVGTPAVPRYQRVIEDYKGFTTELYRWKKKHLEAEYDLVLKESGHARRR